MLRSALVVALFITAMSGGVLAQTRAPAPAPKPIVVRDYMTVEQFRATGMSKLTPTEMQALNQWFSAHTLRVFSMGQGRTNARRSGSSGTHFIEHAINDETFIINGNVFKAKLYCMSYNEGDLVRFLEGSATGACVSAKLLNTMNGDVCEVWCE